MDGTRCPSCGQSNPPGFAFCGHCGTPLAPAAHAPWFPTEERKLVTILFADITDSTVLGARRDPEIVRAVVARFFAAMREEIRRFAGSVEKFIGDAVMAVFGLPAAHEDDPIRAVRAALAMRARMTRLNEDLRAEFGITLGIHIGIESGEVMAAAGPAEGRDFLVTGDAVNTAARLQHAAGLNEIVVGERTIRIVRGMFQVRSRGLLSLKGKEDVGAWQVVGEEEAREVQAAAPFIGREAEMNRLAAIYRDVVAYRQPRLVLLTGLPGIGKTRLAGELEDRLVRGESPPVVRVGRCSAYGEQHLLQPLVEILRQEAVILESDDPATAREKLAGAARALDIPDAVDALAYAMGVEDEHSLIARFDPKAAYQEVVRAWTSYLAARARSAPLVLRLDDLQWASDVLLDLVGMLEERFRDAPAFVLALGRPEVLDRRPEWPRHHIVLTLDGLGAAESGHLLDDLLPAQLPAAQREALLGKAEGNPLFLEEMAQMVVERGGGGARFLVVPDTIQGIIAARLDRLAPAEKAVLQAAAVVGRHFSRGALQALTGTEEVEVLLRPLLTRGFVRPRFPSSQPRDPEYAFKHILTQEVAYNSLPKGTRGRLHGQIAAWIERTAGAPAPDVIDALAHHYQQAATLGGGDEGATSKAATYLYQAALAAYRRYALDRALVHADAAQRFAEPASMASIHELLGDIAFLIGAMADAEGHYRRAADLAARPLDRARALRKLAPAVGVPQALAHLRAAQALLADDPDDAEEAAINTWLGRAAHHQMDYAAALEAFQRARAMLHRPGDRVELAWCLSFLCETLPHLGRIQESFEAAAELRRLAEELDHPYFAARAHRLLGEAHAVLGDYVQAADHADRALAAARTADEALITASSLRLQGMIFWRLGRLDDALVVLREAMALSGSERAESPVERTLDALATAAVLSDLGRIEEAAWTVDTAQRATNEADRGDLLVRVAGMALQVALRAGDPAAPLDRCQELLDRQPGSRLMLAQLLPVIAEGQLLRGETVRAEETARRGWAIAAEDDSALEALLAQRTVGRVALSRANLDQAEHDLSESAAGLFRLGARLESARAWRDLGRAARAAGRDGVARMWFQQAAAVFAECNAVPDLEETEAFLESGHQGTAT